MSKQRDDRHRRFLALFERKFPAPGPIKVGPKTYDLFLEALRESGGVTPPVEVRK